MVFCFEYLSPRIAKLIKFIIKNFLLTIIGSILIKQNQTKVYFKTKLQNFAQQMVNVLPAKENFETYTRCTEVRYNI